MNRPHYDSGGVGLYRKQKYSFPITRENTEDWGRAIEILCEDLDFHELLAKHGLKVMIGTDWHIYFKNTWDGKVTGPRYSRLMKAIWDNFRAVLDDYSLRLKNNLTGEMMV